MFPPLLYPFIRNPNLQYNIHYDDSNDSDVAALLYLLVSSTRLVGSFSLYIIDLDEESTEKIVSYMLDAIFTTIFLLEFTLKTVTYGFFIGKGTYMKDNWNVLDFIIVVISILDLSLTN